MATPYIHAAWDERPHHTIQDRALTERLSRRAQYGATFMSCGSLGIRILVTGLVLFGHAVPSAAQRGAPVEWDEPTHHALQLVLPTENDRLFHDDGPGFYQYTDRQLYPGVAMPWEGGKYGFVRNIRETAEGAIFTRFHEGMDIRPLERSSSGDPLDEVRSIDDGLVVHTNRTARHSTYGLYVVVEHWWSGSPFYSLYAHLKEVRVEVGQEVDRGERIGTIGYTGVGINRRRAHVHVEVNLLLNQRFQEWHDEWYEDELNYHGNFNGFNLAGLDVAALFLELREDPTMTIREFLRSQTPFFRVVVKSEGILDILRRYPWLSPGANHWSFVQGSEALSKPSWTITFARSGLPLRIEASDRWVDDAEVEVLEQTELPYSYLTNGLLSGRGGAPSLSRSGIRLIDLVTRK